MERKELEKHLVPIEDQKKRLKDADDVLPQDVKDQYPVESLREIRKNYKNKWVAFLITDVNEGSFPSAGRVVATAAKYDRSKFEAIRDSFWERLNRHPFIIYTKWLENHPATR